MKTPSKLSRAFKLRHLEIEPSDEKITDAVGLGILLERFDESPLSKEFAKCLPERSSPRSLGSYRLALTQMASFIYGHDCLDDLVELREDPYLETMMREETAAPRTMGDFLRDFEEDHIESLNRFMPFMAKTLRAHLSEALPEEYRPGPLVIDLDSTDHIQSGQKMEGVAWNYKGHWGLDSQVAYDDYGLCYGMQLRPGNTKSGVEAEKLIENIFSGMSFREEKHFRGDSAYLEQDVLRACLRFGVTFTIAAHDGYTGWKENRHEIVKWTPWEYTKAQIEKALKKGYKLSQIELGYYYWQPGWAPNLRFPLIVKRTWCEGMPPEKTNGQQRLPIDAASGGYWEYYAIVTNHSLYNHSLQHVFEFYQKRGNAERFIREEKYGYDLKNFPCLKLMANHAFGLLAMAAHNLLRWAAIVEKPNKPNFAKKLRRRLIHVPGKLLTGQNQPRLKVPKAFYEEVKRFIQALTALPIPSLAPG